MQFNHLKPLVIFDEGCGFCNRCVLYWKLFTKSKVDYVSYQIASAWFPEEQQSAFPRALHFIDPYGRSYKGAEAVFKLFSYTEGLKKYFIYLYQKFRLFAVISEWIYNIIASNRSIFSFFVRILYGDSFRPDTFLKGSVLFYRGLGGIYAVALVSLFVQIKGLFLSSGLFPISVSTSFISWSSFLSKPSLFLISQSDVFILGVLITGIALSILLMAGYYPIILTSVLWFIYLSFVNSGQLFMSFQWDVLLLEVSFLSIFLYPYFTSHVSTFSKMSSFFHFLIKLLLFRVMFFSGLVKVLSGDVSWMSLTALNVHFYTQPLPHIMSWLAFQLPEWVKYISTGAVLFLELCCSWLLFFPRRWRHVSVVLIVILMVMIMGTGNYGFFNILVCVMAVLMISDHAMPIRFNRIIGAQKVVYSPCSSYYRWGVLVLIGSFLLIATLSSELRRVNLTSIPSIRHFNSFHLINNYGLFAVMTQARVELDIQGSNDGIVWSSYQFKYKPNSVYDYPKLVFPHQPRLDWQLWFVPLRPYSSMSWINVLIKELFQGNSAVLSLFDQVPFVEPPKYIRVIGSNRVFSTFSEYKNTGMWWIERETMLYTPVFEFKRS